MTTASIDQLSAGFGRSSAPLPNSRSGSLC